LEDSKLYARILRIATKSFAEKGYHRTTLYDIGRAAHVSESTVVDLFHSKQQLLSSVIAGAFAARTTKNDAAKVIEAIRSDPDFERAIHFAVDRLYRGYDKTYARIRLFIVLERPDLARTFFGDSMQVYYSAIADRLRLERTRGRVRKDIHIDTAARAILFMNGMRRIFEMFASGTPMHDLKRRDMRYFVDTWLRGVLDPARPYDEPEAESLPTKISTVLQG
jgi:AcrR family transcriptional regulator